jgi:Na+/melibiose symporter-like transporter
MRIFEEKSRSQSVAPEEPAGVVPAAQRSGEAVADDARLSVRLKAIYAGGFFGQTVLQNAFYCFVMLFYTDVVALSPQLVGIALAIGRVFDAVTNPAIGQISDRTNTRFGRRRPYIMLGSIFWGATFVTLWLALPAWSQGSKFAYLVAVDVSYALGAALFIVPYLALGAELSLDYDERSSIAGYRIAFMQVGQVVGAAMLTLTILIRDQTAHWEKAGSGGFPIHLPRLLSALPNVEWSLAGILLAVVSVAGMFLSGLIPKERFATRSASGFTSWVAFKTTLSNRNFVRVVATYATYYGFTSLGNFMLPYLLVYYVKKPSYLLPAYAILAVSGVATLPLWLKLGRILEKSVILRIACVWMATACPLSLVLFSPSYPWLIFLLAFWGGSGQAAFETYSHSLLGDVTDEDEMRTGQRREGMYFGVYNLLLKLAISLGLMWSGFALAVVRYVPNGQQSTATLWGMRLLYAVPFLFIPLGLVYLRSYSLDRGRLAVVQKDLRETQSRRGPLPGPVAD